MKLTTTKYNLLGCLIEGWKCMEHMHIFLISVVVLTRERMGIFRSDRGKDSLARNAV